MGILAYSLKTPRGKEKIQQALPACKRQESRLCKRNSNLKCTSSRPKASDFFRDRLSLIIPTPFLNLTFVTVDISIFFMLGLSSRGNQATLSFQNGSLIIITVPLGGVGVRKEKKKKGGNERRRANCDFFFFSSTGWLPLINHLYFFYA